MMRAVIGAAAALAMATAAHAGEWVLDGDASHLAYGSIKLGMIGEVNSFSGLSGKVSPDGAVSVEIDLSSVDTLVDIRNERMREFVFKNAPQAELTAKVDMGKLEALSDGDVDVLPVDGTLSFLGKEVDVSTDMVVARLTDERVMVSTNDMVFVNTATLGIDAGVDKLKELAKLPSIERTVPVTMRLVFTAAKPNT